MKLKHHDHQIDLIIVLQIMGKGIINRNNIHNLKFMERNQNLKKLIQKFQKQFNKGINRINKFTLQIQINKKKNKRMFIVIQQQQDL